MPLGVYHIFHTMRITEDGVWRYYNCPDPVWSEKCRLCREEVARTKAPVPECLNCWKVEVWSLGTNMRQFRGAGGVSLSTYADEQTYLIGALIQRGHRVIAKAARGPILVVRTGIPMEAYPSEEIDYLLMLYAGSIAERDRLRSEAEAVLGRACGAPALPIRRGCWRYDDSLGPWETWYAPDKDYENTTGSVDADPVSPGAVKSGRGDPA